MEGLTLPGRWQRCLILQHSCQVIIYINRYISFDTRLFNPPLPTHRNPIPTPHTCCQPCNVRDIFAYIFYLIYFATYFYLSFSNLFLQLLNFSFYCCFYQIYIHIFEILYISMHCLSIISLFIILCFFLTFTVYLLPLPLTPTFSSLFSVLSFYFTILHFVRVSFPLSS